SQVHRSAWAPMTYSGERPIKNLFHKTKGVLESEASNVGPPNQWQVGRFGGMPPQPELFGNTRVFGKLSHLNENERAPHERSWATSAAFGVILRDCVQMMPGTHPNTT